MSREIPLYNNLLGLRVSALPSFFVAFVVLWLVLAAIGIALVHLPAGDALLAGLLATVLHYACEFAHHYGHSLAARRTGHPMIGVRFWFLIATSLYPANEGDLPGNMHIRRALGGPIISTGVTILLGILLLVVGRSDSLWWWVLLFLFLDNLLVFALGALIPLKFGAFVTDGATILYWLRRRETQA
jgi:Zn-dependent protease